MSEMTLNAAEQPIDELVGLCGIISTNVEYSLLDRTWTGTAKVRIYVGNESAVAWTNVEATQATAQTWTVNSGNHRIW